MRYIKGYYLFERYKSGKFLLSKNIEDLPKDQLIVKHYHRNDEIHSGNIGLFASPLKAIGYSERKNVTYIAIDNTAIIITVHSTYNFLEDRNLKNYKFEYNKYYKGDKRFKFRTIRDLWIHNECLALPDQCFYFTQREALNILKKEGPIDILEMMYEDDISPHQYLLCIK
jgi:hypothetical protein